MSVKSFKFVSPGVFINEIPLPVQEVVMSTVMVTINRRCTAPMQLKLSFARMLPL